NLQISSSYIYTCQTLQALTTLTHITTRYNNTWYRFLINKIYYSDITHTPITIILLKEQVNNSIFEEFEIIHNISEIT
ncbi:MAG: hypothetical protein ACC656_14170, partial [Candidatus Heimdallarchaeota archaeon]